MKDWRVSSEPTTVLTPVEGEFVQRATVRGDLAAGTFVLTLRDRSDGKNRVVLGHAADLDLLESAIQAIRTIMLTPGMPAKQ